MPPRLIALFAVAVACTGCDGHRVPPGSKHLPASVATPPSDASLLRILHVGGTAELLHANTLAPQEWIITGGLPPLTRVIGTNADNRTIYALDAAGRLVAVDLLFRRWHDVPTAIRQFVTSPDGTILGLDSTRHVLRFDGRDVTRYRTPVERGAALLRGPGDDVIVVSDHPGNLQLLGAAGELRHVAVPNGRVTATWIGDLVAVVTDTGVAFVDPTGRIERGRKASSVHEVPLRGTPIAATFSPSGHRLYVARKQRGLVMIDRFTRKVLRELPLPGPADALRADRSGRWLMAHDSSSNMLWVIDLSRWAIASTRIAPWSDNLPQVIDGHTLLARSTSDLVAVDLDGDTSHNQGTLLGGANDLYIMLPWIPQQLPAPQLAVTPQPPAAAPTGAPRPATPTVAPASAPPPPPAEAAAGANLYLQVSSSQNQDWAKAFAQQLKDGGFPAKVLDPASSDEGYRVVVGPYRSRPEADSVGKRLGRSYFIITPDAGGT